MGLSSGAIRDPDAPPLPPPTPKICVVQPPIEVPGSIHRVPLPAAGGEMVSAARALWQRLGEVFFPDDPLHQFRGQPYRRKLLLGLQCVFPIIQWGSEYSLKLLRSDAIAGLTIASLAIPQGISYAKLASLPPIIGLYSSFVPPLVYSVLGSSRDLAVGPVSIASLVMGAMLREMVSPDHQPLLYLQLAFTATFFAGIFQASLGFLRLGFIVDYLSKPTLVGFMAGAAIIVSLQQLKGFFGMVHFTNQMGIVPVLQSTLSNKNEWSWQTILMGISFLSFLLATRHISMKRPKLFWVSAAAPLTSVILSTLISFAFRAQINQKITVIGHLQRGINPPSADMLYFNSPYLGLAVKTGLVSGIMALTEGIAVGRTFASLKNYQVDGNKEMTAIGLMNMIGSCTSCYVTTGSFSRSAVNYNAGAQTAFSNIIMASAVLVTMLLLMPLFYYTPNVILSVIIIAAVIGLIDIRAAVRLWRLDKLDFLSCLVAFLGVLLISVQMGLVLAVGISILKILMQVTRPNTVIKGVISGTQSYRSLSQYREAVRVPSFLILGIESPMCFANCTYLQERILRWLREEDERAEELNHPCIKCVILDMNAATAIDTSGLDMLRELKKMLDKQSIELILVNPVANVIEKLHKSDVWELFGTNRLYMTVGEAVDTVTAVYKCQP